VLFAVIVAGSPPRAVLELWFATLMLGAILIPPFLFGFGLYPALYIGLGFELLRGGNARRAGAS
jgi:hypothetical protein